MSSSGRNQLQAAYNPSIPPFFASPAAFPELDGSIHSTLNLLESLDDYYRNQRVWIEQARNALDRAFEESEVMQSEQSKSALPSPPASESDSSSPDRSDITSDDEQRPRSGSFTRFESNQSRKKKGLQLSVDIQNSCSHSSLSHKRVRRITSRKDLEQRKQMLNMLDEMMQARMDSCKYTALNSRADRDAQHDMEAAFDYSEDDEDENVNNAHESHPLNPDPTSPSRIEAPAPIPHPHVPGTYDFENVDYDYPPPGSPPRPSAIALPNNIGNSNGLIPPIPDGGLAPRQNWFKRSAAAVLPTELAQRIGLTHQRPQGAIGGGTNNDGVFANVTAKPTRGTTLRDGDDNLIVPEETRAEAPPSYASAQADAVPPYWETTVHAPFTPGTMGDIIVDNLPTGSLFSFMWNMLVSISFQFVGFLLTYLLHTTHAAKLGSRAGLGVTLIQYGFALRGRLDNTDGMQDNSWGSWGVARPTTTEGVPPYMGHAMNATATAIYAAKDLTEAQTDTAVSEATTEWLSFFLMTVGWFILLTSLLGYWRVKRWERGILASQRESATPTETASPFAYLSRMENSFSLRSSRIDLFRNGFGLGRGRNADLDEEAIRAALRAEEGTAHPPNEDEHATETDVMIPADPNSPDRQRLLAALERDRRLQADLRNAGLL
ncbi:hypothetical protein DXG01_003089 [Tephrocybe rancida]|nr:hypothetical protein DXG01_003089 [Tephrocybe rancida]